MPGIYDRDPLELAREAVRLCEREVATAEADLEHSTRQVEADKLVVGGRRKQLRRWEQALRALTPLPVESELPPCGRADCLANCAECVATLDCYPDPPDVSPQPLCTYGCGTPVNAVGDWCMTTQCRDAHSAQSGGDT